MIGVELPCACGPTAWVSDAHLGVGDRADNGARDRHLLYAWLKALPPEYAIWCVGDTFELWENRAQAVIDHNLGLIHLLGHRGAYYVIGNHDRALRPFAPLGDRVELIGSGLHWFAEHGHGVDARNRDGAWTGWLATAITGVGERLGLRPVEWLGHVLETGLAKALRLARWTGDCPQPYLERAATVLRDRPYTDLYLFGHTHGVGIWESWALGEITGVEVPEGRVAVNLGAWDGRRRTVTAARGRVLVQGDVGEWAEMEKELAA